MNKKQEIIKPAIQAAVIIGIFYAIEIPMVSFDLFPDYNVLLMVDIALRIVMGIIALVLLRPSKELFTNKVTPKMWLVILPFLIYVALPLAKICFADVYVPDNIPLMVIPISQQFAVGFFEEAYAKGLFMKGFLKCNTSTVKQRLVTCALTGTFFGMTHLLNIFFGDNPLLQVPACIVWGFFIAAVYMLTENLPLVMLLHAISDITPRISHGLFGWTVGTPAVQVIEVMDNVFQYVILPLAAVYICFRYVSLKGIVKKSKSKQTTQTKPQESAING